MSLSSGLANAAYAAGTVLAVQFAQHLPQRRMLIVYATLLVIGSVLAAAAQDPACTSRATCSRGLHEPAADLRRAAAGDRLSGEQAPHDGDDHEPVHFRGGRARPSDRRAQAQSDAWRPLFWVIAAIAACALVLAVLTFDDAPAPDPESPIDPLAIALAVVGCAAAFFGASELLTHRFLDGETIVPLLAGLATIVVLIVYQFRAKRPLLTIRLMLTSTMPGRGHRRGAVCGCGLRLGDRAERGRARSAYRPLHLGLLYLPEVDWRRDHRGFCSASSSPGVRSTICRWSACSSSRLGSRSSASTCLRAKRPRSSARG